MDFFRWKERRPDSICFPALTVFSLGEMWGMSSPPHCEHKSFYQEWRWCCLLDRYYMMFSCSQHCRLCDVQHVHWVTAAWRPCTDVYSHRLVVIAFLRVCVSVCTTGETWEEAVGNASSCLSTAYTCLLCSLRPPEFSSPTSIVFLQQVLMTLATFSPALNTKRNNSFFFKHTNFLFIVGMYFQQKDLKYSY